jgi:hypothetical protein
MSTTELITQPQRELRGKNFLHGNVKETTAPTSDGSAEHTFQHNRGKQ